MKKMFALLLILAGTLALVDNLHLFEVRHLIDYLWPSFLILLGLSGLVGKNKNVLLSFILILIGATFLAKELGFLVYINVSDFIFPVILIVIGAALLFPNRNNESVHEEPKEKAKYTEYSTKSEYKKKEYYTQFRESNQREYNSILSSRNEKVVNKTFRQVTLNTILGGAHIDFREIELEGDVAYIDINCVMGSTELYLPKGYKVVINGTPILGQLSHNLENDNNALKTIEVNYAVVLGNIHLKH